MEIGLPLCGGFFFSIMKQKIDKNYKGRMLVGNTAYHTKPPQEMGGKVKNEVKNEVYVTNTTLAEMINEGYPYCPTAGKLENVTTSDYICIDIDYSIEPMDEFVSALAFQPTIFYETESNNTELSIEKSMKKFKDPDHKYRFRMIYALQTPTASAGEYESVFNHIVKGNSIDPEIVDGRKANQYYFGSYNCNYTVTDYVYDFSDHSPFIDTDKKSVSDTPIVKNNTYNVVNDTFFDTEVLSSFYRLSYKDFIEWFEERYGRPNVITETEYVQSEEDERKRVPLDKYYSIPIKKHRDVEDKKKMVFEKWKDGEMRHKKIYQTGLILRNLNKDIDQNVMLYSIVDIMLKHYSLKNNNGTVKFTRKYVTDLIKRIMKAEIREMKEIKHSSYHVSDRYCKQHNVAKSKVVGELNGEQSRLKKEERFKEIDWFYDASLTHSNGKKITQKQWLKILKENGIKISLKTFNRYLDERGYTNKHRKSVSDTPIVITNTYNIVDDTFCEDEDDVSLARQDRQFWKIIRIIHESVVFKERWAV